MIKVASLQSNLHATTNFNQNNALFLQEIENSLGEKIIKTTLDDYDCDLKLIFVSSGGSEGIFLENYAKLKEPYIILTSGANNSLAASLEILTYLNSQKKKCEILHGSTTYIASRIKELLKETKSEVSEPVNMGIIGKPSDWLIASIPSYEEVKKKFNINLINISLDELIKNYNTPHLLADLSFDAYFDKEEIHKASLVYHALKKIIQDYNLASLTLRCFDLLTSIHTTGCLALAKLNEEGTIATCEGDITALISMWLIKKYFNASSFQANPSVIDVERRECIFAHCTIPLDMVSSYDFDTHFESKIGVAVKGNLYEKKVTIFRLSSDFSRYFLEEARITENLKDPSLCRTQIKVVFDNDISPLLKNPCGNHHIIFYGKHKKVLEKNLKELI